MIRNNDYLFITSTKEFNFVKNEKSIHYFVGKFIIKIVKFNLYWENNKRHRRKYFQRKF
jgi:hypothetical protein